MTRRFRRSAFVLIGLVAALVFHGCDETLPPQEAPQYYLQVTFQPIEGTVAYLPGDTLPTSLPGSFLVSVRNLHDEVLQSNEDIHVDIDIWDSNFPTQKAHILGDRNNLLNYDMLDGDMLTILPDSSARILVGWNQRTSDGRFFAEFTNLTRKIGGGSEYIESDPLTLNAKATIRSFKIAPTYTADPVLFKLIYFIRISISQTPWNVTNFTAKVGGNGIVKINWETDHEAQCYGFYVERMPIGGYFEALPDGFIKGHGTTSQTHLYQFTDTSVVSGLWDYRLHIMLDLGMLKWTFGYSDTVHVDVP